MASERVCVAIVLGCMLFALLRYCGSSKRVERLSLVTRRMLSPNAGSEVEDNSGG